MSDFPMIDMAKTGQNIIKLRKQNDLSVKELQIISVIFKVTIEEILVLSTEEEQPAAKELPLCG